MGPINVRIITQTLGYGEIKTISSELEIVREIEDDEKFIHSRIDQLIEVEGISYKCRDILKEHFLKDGSHCYIFYIRYKIDAESENFKRFVKGARPGDLIEQT